MAAKLQVGRHTLLGPWETSPWRGAKFEDASNRSLEAPLASCFLETPAAAAQQQPASTCFFFTASPLATMRVPGHNRPAQRLLLLHGNDGIAAKPSGSGKHEKDRVWISFTDGNTAATAADCARARAVHAVRCRCVGAYSLARRQMRVGGHPRHDCRAGAKNSEDIAGLLAALSCPRCVPR